MKAEYTAIAKLLMSGKRTAQCNRVWMQIHEETGLGAICGRQLQFTGAELHKLREHARHKTGLDPQFDAGTGNRLAMSGKTDNEKLATGTVFGDLLVLATAGDACVTVHGQSATTPPGAVLSVQPEALDRGSLRKTPLVIVENGALMPCWQDIRLPPAWQNSVILYRGHGDNHRHVQKIIQEQPGDTLALYYDFDPEGLDMALRIGKGAILIPENWRELPDWLNANDDVRLNQRATFRRQSDALTRARKQAENRDIDAVIATVEQHELAVMQEHITHRRWALVACA